MVEHFASVFAPEEDAFDAHFDALATGDTLDKDGFESLARARCFPTVEKRSPTCRVAGWRGSRAAPRVVGAASTGDAAAVTKAALDSRSSRTTMRRAGVLDDEVSGLYQGLLDAGYDLGAPEALQAEMGGTSFRDFVGWFEGLCAAADDGVDELCAATEGVAVDA